MNFYTYNQGAMFGDVDWVRFVYRSYEPLATAQADLCIGCRECEEKCTQHIEISAWMPKVHAVLGEGQPYP